MNKNTQKTMFSKESDEYETPKVFFDLLQQKFGVFTLDPCATKENAKCAVFYTKDDNGLLKSWKGHKVFCNPPYSENKTWIEKCLRESQQDDTEVILLIPSRTDTRYWYDYCMKAKEIYFVKGRLKFGNMKNTAPFPSAIIVFNNQYRSGCPIVGSIVQ